ncbi:MAG: hypothetical protein R6W78_03875 [Bacteroidales bacterium]
MRKSNFILMTVACVSFTLSNIYAQEPSRKTEKAKDNLQDAKIEVVEAKQEMANVQNSEYQDLKKESDKKFKSNQDMINDLKIKILKNNDNDSSTNNTRLSTLEQKNHGLQKQLADYKDEGPEKWATFKFKYNYEMDELEKSLKDFTIVSMK